MPDIFGRTTNNLNGVFTADSAKLTLNGLPLPLLTQQLNFSYAQTVTRLYEVGTSNMYYVGGRTQGNLAINRVIGPSATVQQFYNTYGNICNARNNNISLNLSDTDCSQSGGAGNAIPYNLLNCVIMQVSVGVQAQDMVITENTSLMYTSLTN